MSKTKLDLEHQCLRIDDREYYYEEKDRRRRSSDSDDADFYWFEIDERFAVSDNPEDSDDEQIPVERAREIDPTGMEWTYARVQIEDSHKLRKLNRAFTKAKLKAEEKAKRKEEEEEHEEKKGESDEENQTRHSSKADKRKQAHSPKIAVRRLSRSTDSGDDYEKFNWKVMDDGKQFLHKKSKELGHGWYREADGELERVKSSDRKERLQALVLKSVSRTKWGTRIYSNDDKHFFTVGVWKSTKYSGCSTIRLSVAGKNYMYTLDETNMKALRAEISRGMPT
jgi:hypothetical protein